MSKWERIAKEAYIAYVKAVDGIAFNGDILPEWENLNEQIQAAWMMSVKRAVEYNQEIELKGVW